MTRGRIVRAIRRVRRKQGAIEGGGYLWFRAGYRAALTDLVLTGKQPLTDLAIREAADEALKRWVDLTDESELTNG